ncbi:transposase family protein (plasmid) [Streptomyces globisporus]|uniref:helix-turn-helix domain-containing protein n=1 Tax=Streptomyces globisporus TaxID=1908 RepID=UPI002F91B851|nr:transposase family protein [Streptomyces globisporus]
MSWNVTTGWATGRLDGLVVRVHRVFVVDPDPSAVPGRMWSLGLCKSVVLVLFLLRQNPVEEAAAELFGISRATVSRRWTALLPVVEKVLAAHVPAPAEASAGRIVLIDGTLVTTWDRASEGTTMFSGKHRDTGFNLQLTATLAAGRLAVSEPAPGSRVGVQVNVALADDEKRCCIRKNGMDVPLRRAPATPARQLTEAQARLREQRRHAAQRFRDREHGMDVPLLRAPAKPAGQLTEKEKRRRERMTEQRSRDRERQNLAVSSSSAAPLALSVAAASTIGTSSPAGFPALAAAGPSTAAGPGRVASAVLIAALDGDGEGRSVPFRMSMAV